MSGSAETGQEPDGEIELIAQTDATESAFTIALPRGWRNQAYSLRLEGALRSVVTARNPDDGTFLWIGDPNLPGAVPATDGEPPPAAEPFFRRYLRLHYSHAPGFQITQTTPCPALAPLLRAARTIDFPLTTVSFSFAYTDRETLYRARLHGAVFREGMCWLADVCGIVTGADRDPAVYDTLLFRIRRTQRRHLSDRL